MTKLLYYLFVSILFAVAGLVIGMFNTATAVSYTGVRVKEQFTYKPKGKHRKW